MRYRCLACDYTFTVAEGEQPRCPKCFRIHGLEPVDAPGQKPAARPASSSRTFLVVGAFLLAAGAGYFFYARAGKGGSSGPPSALGHGSLKSAASGAGIADTEVPDLFAPVEELGKQAQGSDAEAKARSLDQAVRKLITDKKIAPTDMERAPRKVRTSTELWKDIAGGKPDRAASIELAALAVGAARAVGLDVELHEIVSADGHAGDRSGLIGAFAAVVKTGKGQVVIDAYSGRKSDTPKLETRALSPAEALAGYYNARALVRLASDDNKAAYEDAERALKLAPNWSAAHDGKGVALLTAGSASAALEEFKKAVTLRDLAPQRRLVAVGLMADGDWKRADQELEEALKRDPNYGPAYATRAQVKVAEGETEAAEAALAKAKELEPHFGELSRLDAALAVRKGKLDEAMKILQARIDAVPDDEPARLLLGDMMLRTGKMNEAFELVEKGMTHSRAPQRLKARIDKLRELIASQKADGGAAEANPPPPAADGGAAAAPAGDGGAAAPPEPPSTPGPESSTPSGPMPEMPKLQLEEPNFGTKKRSRLRLE